MNIVIKWTLHSHLLRVSVPVRSPGLSWYGRRLGGVWLWLCGEPCDCFSISGSYTTCSHIIIIFKMTSKHYSNGSLQFYFKYRPRNKLLYSEERRTHTCISTGCISTGCQGSLHSGSFFFIPHPTQHLTGTLTIYHTLCHNLHGHILRQWWI